MAVHLTSWLHDEVKTQLELGHSWLEEQHRIKARRASPSAAYDSKWDGIYHNNGSCIDIIGPSSSLHAQVLVLKTKPLLISDGHHHTETSLTNACRESLLVQHSGRPDTIGTVWNVKKYTIRYTSYGNPRSKLRFILDELDRVGNHDTSQVHTDPANALNRSQDIASTLLQLDRSRLRDDIRCLQPQTKEEEDLDDRVRTMGGANEPPEEDASSLNTQMPFGTQMPHPTRPRRDDDEISFMGINRMEPVLGGNTQRAELKPRSAHSVDARQNLLALLKRGQPPVPLQSSSRTSPPKARTAQEHSPRHPSRSENTPSKPAIRDKAEDSHAGAVEASTDKGKKRVREAENEPQPARPSEKKTSSSETESQQQSRASEMDKFAAECSWMKGLKLNRASATVPDDQALLLQKPESWYKPEPGQRSVNEVPVQILMVLSRMADEAAALEGATSSGSYHETDPSSGSYAVNSAPQPISEDSSESEDEAATSPVSWHTSPSPQPPERPDFSHQGLPPDSSIEMPEDGAKAEWPHVLKTRNSSPHRTLPASSHEREIGLSPSSPPAPQAPVDSDDDMELEISVPQALGEDSQLPPVTHHHDHQPRAERRSHSVVQVKETPYVKGKNGQQPVLTVLSPTQRSNEQLEHSSSASVIRGTYVDLSSSAVEETRLDALGNDIGGKQQRVSIIKDQTHVREASNSTEHKAQDTSMLDVSSHEAPVMDTSRQSDNAKQTSNLHAQAFSLLQPEPTPVSAQLPPKDSSSGEQAVPTPNKGAHMVHAQPAIETTRRPSATPSVTKRKRSPASPGERRQRSKKRQLKKVLFGSGRNKVDSEGHQSTTSTESRQGSVSNASVQHVAADQAEDVNKKKPAQPEPVVTDVFGEAEMSPRHRSLYAPPSPVMQPAAISIVAPTSEAVDAALTEQEDLSETTATGQATKIDTIQKPQAAQKSPEPPQMHDPTLTTMPMTEAQLPTPLPEPQQPKLEVVIRAEQATPIAPSDEANSATVFQMFKAAYPEYKGSVKHFTNQCKLIEKLDREDKMVSRWMWDDFVIRNQTDYRRYVNDCAEAGEEPEPYIRFYKDTFPRAKYEEGIITTRALLVKALQQLGVRPDIAGLSPAQLSNQQEFQPRSHESPTPSLDSPVYNHQSYQQFLRQSPRKPVQQTHQMFMQPSPRQPLPRLTQSSMPAPAQPATTPVPKRKPSRKSLPFPAPSMSTPGRISGTTNIRHSLPASSSGAAPMSTHSSARPASSARAKAASAFGDTLRSYKAGLPSSSVGSGTGDEFREFLRANHKLTSVTGSTRIDKSKPWPDKIEMRPSVQDLPRRKVDVLEWTDEL